MRRILWKDAQHTLNAVRLGTGNESPRSFVPIRICVAHTDNLKDTATGVATHACDSSTPEAEAAELLWVPD